MVVNDINESKPKDKKGLNNTTKKRTTGLQYLSKNKQNAATLQSRFDAEERDSSIK